MQNQAGSPLASGNPGDSCRAGAELGHNGKTGRAVITCGAQRAGGIVQESRPISWRMKLLLGVGGALTMALILEVGLRTVSGWRAYKAQSARQGEARRELWATYDPDILYRGAPNFPGRNSDGLFDYEIGPKIAGRTRVLFLGDSVCEFGDAIENTVIGHLRKELGLRLGRPVDVINSCTEGWGTKQELGYLRKYGIRFQPDQVGIVFCLNDVHEALTTIRVENGKLVPGTFAYNPEALEKARTPFEKVRDRSHLLTWLYERAPVVSSYIRWQREKGFSFDYHIVRRLAWQDQPWVATESYLKEMKNSATAEHPFSVFLIVVPLAEQYREDYLVRDRSYVLKPQRKLKEMCQRLEFPCYDPYSQMNARLFVSDGLHLNEEGRTVLARLVAEFMLRNGMMAGDVGSGSKPE